MKTRLTFGLGVALLAQAVAAEPPIVTSVEARSGPSGWRFDVTLAHPDTGWDHYADGWEVMDDAGNSLGLRELLHPHVNEQPFTRSLSGVAIPEGVAVVYVRGRCNIDGWSQPVKVTLPDT